jgi:hypothetical protein
MCSDQAVQPPESASPHPVDRLIMRLVHDPESVATPADVAAIVERIATAPFSRRPVRLRSRDRELTYGGITAGRTADSLALHLAKRVQQERQWIVGTTADDYLTDLRTAARHPGARVLVYERAAEIFAATISPTQQVVSPRRRGADWFDNLLVVHSARYGVLVTGYMYSEFGRLDMPEEIRWLR